MADVQYINPTALKPEIGWAPKNALAGMMYNQNERDFRRSFEQQMRLQALGEQEKMYDFEEKQAGRPTRDVLRDVKGATARGQLPLAREAAASGMRTQMAEDKFNQSTKFSPENIKATLASYTAQMDEAKFKKFANERTQEYAAIESLINARKKFGDAYAIGQAKQLRQRLAQAGINLPNDIEDPRKWDFMYNTLKESVKFIQERELKKQETDAAMDRTRVSAGATRYAADRALEGTKYRTDNAAEKAPSTNNPNAYVNYMENQVRKAIETNQLSDPMVRQYAEAAKRDYEERVKQMYAMQIISKPIAEQMLSKTQEHVDGTLARMGIRRRSAEGGGTGSPTPANTGQGSPGKQERKPLGSFD